MTVAIKVLRPELAVAVAAERFAREVCSEIGPRLAHVSIPGAGDGRVEHVQTTE